MPVDAGDPSLLLRLAVALGLGLLVGMQRERSGAIRFAGVRTFPLIALLGGTLAAIAQSAGPWIVPAGLVGLAAMIVMSNVVALKQGQIDRGVTTEVAALLMFGVGALAVAGPLSAAVALGAGMAVLLHAKAPLHNFVRTLGDEDMRAIMRFALISLVILPVLPDQTYGPFDVLNPRQIWLMVVLVVGISLLGYVAYKLVGARAGAMLGGAIGGLISSTATTVSYARRAKGKASRSTLAVALFVIYAAGAIMYGRVYVEALVVAPALARALLLPLGAMFAATAILAAFALLTGWRKGSEGDSDAPANPAELKPALLFGLLYATVLFLAAAAKARFDPGAVYIVAVLSGLIDMDAITLSTARLVASESLEATHGWRIVVVAAISNMAFKSAAVWIIGGLRIGWRVSAGFALGSAVGVALLIFL